MKVLGQHSSQRLPVGILYHGRNLLTKDFKNTHVMQAKSNPKKPFDFVEIQALSFQNRTLELGSSNLRCSTKKKGFTQLG